MSIKFIPCTQNQKKQDPLSFTLIINTSRYNSKAKKGKQKATPKVPIATNPHIENFNSLVIKGIPRTFRLKYNFQIKFQISVVDASKGSPQNMEDGTETSVSP